jgi:glycosyltransferase involved in cell wall biosynthesis
VHVLVANKIYPPIMAGGAELVVSYLCEELAARGHRVTVVSTCGPEMEPYPVEHRNGVESIRFFPANLYWNYARGIKPREDHGNTRLAAMRAGLRTARWHLTDAWNRDAGRRLGAILADARPDILHTHLLDGLSASVWRAAKHRRMPVIHTAHDYHLLCPRAFLLDRSWNICTHPALACRTYRGWHLRTTSEVDLFTSPSRFLLDLHLAAGLRSPATAVVANGIPLPRAARQRHQGRRNRFVLMTRLTVEKGIRVVLDALKRIPKLDLTVAVAGGGPLEPELRAAAARDRRIQVLGFVDGEAKQAALASADHLILPSLWYENAPTVILEAAANGLTLIGSRIGGIPEFVREGQTGLLFPPGDAAGLATAMQLAMDDTAMADGLADHGAAMVDAHTVPRMADAYLEHYERLLARVH